MYYIFLSVISFMKIIDKYIISEWLKVFFGALVLTLGILTLHNAYRDLPDLISFGASVWQIVYYHILLLPAYIPVILPISLLLSVIFTLGNLHRNSEIIAMRAAGLSLFRISRSLWFVGFLLSGILFYLNSEIIPQATEQARSDYEALELKAEPSKTKARASETIRHLTLNNSIDSRIWFIDVYKQLTGEFQGVEIHSLDKEGNQISSIKANSGFYKEGIWTFFNGVELAYDPNTNKPLSLAKFDKKEISEYNESPALMILSRKRPKDLSVLELRQLTSTLGEKKEMLAYAVQLQTMLTSPFICIIVIAIAIPFSVAGVRTNPMVGVSKTIGLFFAYYILVNIFTALGGKEVLSPVMAAWIPNIFMLFFALNLYRKNI